MRLLLVFFFIFSLHDIAEARKCGLVFKEYFSVENSKEKIVLPKYVELLLKSLKRAGWPLRGIPHVKAESVWQHSIKVEKAAVILFRLFDPEYRNFAASIGRVHDVGEAIVGDFTPHDKISSSKKYALEKKAITKIAAEMPRKEGLRLIKLWLHYEQQTNYAAKYIKDLDKIDAAVQAMEYANLGYNTSEFFPYTKKAVVTPELKNVYEQLLNEFYGGRLDAPYERYFELLFDAALIPQKQN